MPQLLGREHDRTLTGKQLLWVEGLGFVGLYGCLGGVVLIYKVQSLTSFSGFQLFLWFSDGICKNEILCPYPWNGQMEAGSGKQQPDPQPCPSDLPHV